LAYFRRNARAPRAIPWDVGADLSAPERAAIEDSVRGFQRGESSEGRRLLRYAESYARRTGDRDYLEAMRLFIREEQRHSRELARFLILNSIPLTEADSLDGVFRWMRHLGATLEIAIAVLISAEIIAQVYYAALKAATQSRVLGALCDVILRDEARHVEFQSQRLARLRASRSQLLRRGTDAVQRLLFAGTCIVVWLFHRPVFERGGLKFAPYWREVWKAFRVAFASADDVTLWEETTAARRAAR
jgi:hypothetical protein